MMEQIITSGMLTPVLIVVLVLMIAFSMFHVLREYERGVIFSLAAFKWSKARG